MNISKNLFTLLLVVLIVSAYSQSPQNVLSWIKFDDVDNSLVNHLSGQAISQIEQFESKYTEIRDQDTHRRYQNGIKKTIWNALGGIPHKSPLNARVTNIISKNGYTLENIIFESLPGFYVTGTLFIPDGLTSPGPAILFCSGHSTEAYRRKSYQLPMLNLVKKGFIVLAIDPIGQGERSQYFEALQEKSIFNGRSTQEHSYPSVQSFLIGQSVAKYFTWDGIRAIDFLCSRDEVDEDRIGVHGLSGGGTQTAYISALDDRVKVSAPAGYITSYQRLIESIGVQDGEQNLYHGLKNEINHLDFILARAPKPTLIMATTNDFFSIQGVYETFSKAKEVYKILGNQENLEITEDEYGHGYTRKNREAMYQFFQHHLNQPGKAEESEVEYLSFHDLQKTSTGQVSTALGGETVFSLIQNESDSHLEHLDEIRSDESKYEQNILTSATQLSGYKKPSRSDEAIFVGQSTKEHYIIRMYYMKGEGEYVFPFLKYLPPAPNGQAILYLNPTGKHTVPSVEINYLIEKGFTVYIPDVIGTGELSRGVLKGDAYIGNVSYNVWYTAMLLGRSIVGIQASDVNKLANYIKSFGEISEVFGVAKGEMAPTMLHCGAFDTTFSRMLLIQPYASYAAFVQHKFYNPRYVYSLVPGALTGYDLCDLAALFAPKKLVVAGAFTSTGHIYPMESFIHDWGVTRRTYISKNMPDAVEFLDVKYFREDDFHYAFDRLIYEGP